LKQNNEKKVSLEPAGAIKKEEEDRRWMSMEEDSLGK